MKSPGCQRDEQRTGRRSGEWGFTLPELLATIVIIGIIAAIAIPSFFGLIEARRVESAANQLASDLRLAHSRATNQVGTDWTVSATANSPAYTMNGTARSGASGTKINNAFTQTFTSNGTVSPGGDITVSGRGVAPSRIITISPATSSVEVST